MLTADAAPAVIMVGDTNYVYSVLFWRIYCESVTRAGGHLRNVVIERNRLPPDLSWLIYTGEYGGRQR